MIRCPTLRERHHLILGRGHRHVRHVLADDHDDPAGRHHRDADAVRRDPVDLIETVAERVARVVLGFPVDRTEVTVHKPQAPIAVPFGDVAVTVVRDRAWAAEVTS